jgi:pyruvate dehydrogenase E1 component
VIAASDYVRGVPDLIRTWVPWRYVTLRTDGFARSDTRVNLRRWFEIDRTHIALATIKALADERQIEKTAPQEFEARYGLRPTVRPPWADRREDS